MNHPGNFSKGYFNPIFSNHLAIPAIRMSGNGTTSYSPQKLPVRLLASPLSRSVILARQRDNFSNKCECNQGCRSFLPFHAPPHALRRLFVHRLSSFSEQKHFATIHLATQFGRTSEDKFLPLSHSFGSSLKKHLESNHRQLDSAPLEL